MNDVPIEALGELDNVTTKRDEERDTDGDKDLLIGTGAAISPLVGEFVLVGVSASDSVNLNESEGALEGVIEEEELSEILGVLLGDEREGSFVCEDNCLTRNDDAI
jgi:hypothetical protein